MRLNLPDWLTKVALVAGSLMVTLVLAEIVLRIVGFSNPVFWTYDDFTGSKLVAGAEGWQRAEGEVFISISSDGLRDREHSRTKPPNTVRIAVLGDSMTEALQVPIESAFWSVLQTELKNCKWLAGRDVEVINFGVSGYGTAQELLTYRHRAANYSPDVTILAFYAGNDVRNNSMELEPQKLRPFYLLQDGKLVLDDRFRTNQEYLSFKATFDRRKFLYELRTLQLARKLKSAWEQRQSSGTGAARDTNVEAGLDDSIFLPPKSAAWRDAWQITEQLISATRDEVVAGGGRLVVVSIPIGIQVHPDAEKRKQTIQRLNASDLWYPETRIGEFGEREKIDVITPGRSFQAYAEANQAYLHGFKNTAPGTGHLNETGHRLVGQALAKKTLPTVVNPLRRQFWLEKRVS